MKHLSLKWLVPTVMAVALVAGCGGGGGGSPVVGNTPGAPVTPPVTPPGIGESVEALLAFMTGLLANTTETGDPVMLDNKPLAVDDTGGPAGGI
jgi:hypothetical protein